MQKGLHLYIGEGGGGGGERERETRREGERECTRVPDDDDCLHYHSWRNYEVSAFGTLSSFCILLHMVSRVFVLRVESLMETDSGYPKDTGVTLFTLATPGNFLRHNTPRSALPVSPLAHSRGPGARQAEGL